MMKKLILMSAMLMAFAIVNAQKVTSTNVKMGGINIPGFTVTIEKNIDLVEDAMEQRLKDAGLKMKKNNGFLTAIDQLFAEINSSPVNFYTKIEKDGRSKTNVTVCAIATDLMEGSEKLQDNLRSFLEDFVLYVNKLEARNHMETQQGNLKKATKAAASAVSAVDKLDKGIEKNKEKIADKRKEIAKYMEKIKECEEDIKKLEAEINKNQGKRADAQKDVEKANEKVKNVQGEVDRYRSLSE